MKNKWMFTALSALSHITPQLAARFALNLFATPRRIPYSESAKQLFSPANRFPIVHKGRTLAVYEWGDSNAPAVLLVHGWDSNAAALRAYISPLVARGFRVVAFDSPAQGESGGKQTNILDYADAITHVMATTGPVTAIIGHSFGAAAAMTALDLEIEWDVERVVLLGSPNELANFVRKFAWALKLGDRTLRAMIEQLENRFRYPINYFSVKKVAAKLNLPGLLIHDRRDSIVSFGEAQDIASTWSNARFIVTEGLDHRGALTNPHIIAQVVDFLTADQPVEEVVHERVEQEREYTGLMTA